MSLPPANWHPDPSDPAMIRYWDGTAWTGHTQPARQPTPQPAPQQVFRPAAPQVFQPAPQQVFQPAAPQVFQPMAQQGYDAIGGRSITPGFGNGMNPAFGSRPGGPFAQVPATLDRPRRSRWLGLGAAGALGLVLVAAVIVVVVPRLAPMSPDYTGASVTSSDVPSNGGALAVSSAATVAIEVPTGWVDAATYVDTSEMSVGLPTGIEWLGVWFTSAPSSTNPPELVMVAEASSQAAGIGSLSDFQNQAIGGARASDGVSGVGETADVTLANGLEGKRTAVTLDGGDGTTATMVIATFGHGRRLALVMWVSFSGPVDEVKLQSVLESLRIDS